MSSQHPSYKVIGPKMEHWLELKEEKKRNSAFEKIPTGLRKGQCSAFLTRLLMYKLIPLYYLLNIWASQVSTMLNGNNNRSYTATCCYYETSQQYRENGN